MPFQPTCSVPNINPSTPVSESLKAVTVPHVAIVGRPNVGKSTLFNRIVGRREAIVGREYGMTRDRHTAEADWAGVGFVLTDTGGIEYGSEEELLRQVEEQVMVAVAVADVAVLVVDGRQGPLPVERDIARQLRRHGLPVILAVNKCDTPQLGDQVTAEFHELGVEPVHGVSAEQGNGVNDLLDAVVRLLPEYEETGEAEQQPTRVAVVGRPNVGKSSLVNALLGAERVIVSDVAGTTRDAIDTMLERDGKRYLLVDTAGMRKRAKVDTHAEIASVAMARRRLQRADVALLVIDPQEGLTRQDLHVAEEAGDVGSGLIVVVNKWDLVAPADDVPERMKKHVTSRLARMRYARVAVISALEGRGVEGLLPMVDEVAEARARRVPTADLNRAFEIMVGKHAPAGGTSATQPKYMTQVGIRPPRFVAFAGSRGGDRPDYTRYLENRLREAFDFAGTPIIINVRLSRRRRRKSR